MRHLGHRWFRPGRSGAGHSPRDVRQDRDLRRTGQRDRGRRLLAARPGDGRPPLQPVLPDVRRRRLTAARGSPPARPRSPRSAGRRPRTRRAAITPGQFRAAFGKGTAPVKARLLNQHAIAGIGNLLADQILWQSKINPARPVGELSPADVDRLLRAVRRSVRAAVSSGGVHILPVVDARSRRRGLPPVRGAHAPRQGRRPDDLVVLARAGLARFAGNSAGLAGSRT